MFSKKPHEIITNISKLLKNTKFRREFQETYYALEVNDTIQKYSSLHKKTEYFLMNLIFRDEGTIVCDYTTKYWDLNPS